MKALKKITLTLSFSLLLIITWSVRVYHLGTYPKPILSPEENAAIYSEKWLTQNTWIDKSKFGIHQAILSGSDFERGWVEGHYTQKILERQESELIGQVEHFFPHPHLIQGIEVLLMRWFWGIEDYFPGENVREMYGVSHSASAHFNYLADPLTRQIAYHGIHEVGQMMVDQGSEDMGCTVIALKNPHGWMVGRNFDFEGGRVFDSEKIMKWVFPEKGHAFLSVIWAGMVGAVTAVNDQGLYISLNAAGSTDLSRYGTPSTLVLLKAVQYANSAEEALQIIRDSQMFITDIFVVSDAKSKTTYRIEKSPLHTSILKLDDSTAITNHLVSPQWKNDRINEFRKNELTSLIRSTRGQELIEAFKSKNTPATPQDALQILRDKGVDSDHHALPLGNRRAIDALIATHSVVYDGEHQRIYVSQGPGLAGAFTGFDLTQSFQKRTPILVPSLPIDYVVSEKTFLEIRSSAKMLSQMAREIHHRDCHSIEQFAALPAISKTGYEYHQTLGDFYQCKGSTADARKEWQLALNLNPAYPREIKKLQEKLKK